jgi:hypothetical protein
MSLSTAVQLIYKRDSKLIINQEALKELKEIKLNLAVCVCVGPYRQGKSFLLSKIFDTPNSFKVGHKDDACTDGVWICKHPEPVKDVDGNWCSVILMDTEGLESEENSSSEWDTKLFLFSLLASSMLIYNTKSALSSESLNKLAIAASLGEKIKSRKSSKYDHLINSIFTATTDFIWVVRDFGLATQESPNEKLKKFLTLEPPPSSIDKVTNKKKQDEFNLKNSIRKAINETFDRKECFYVPVPVSDGTDQLTYEEALQSLDTLAYEKLRDPFKEQVSRISKHVQRTIKSKQVENEKMNGFMFCEYLKQIVTNINEENVIYLNETMSTCLRTYAQECLKETLERYRGKMSELFLHGNFLKAKKEFDDKEYIIALASSDFLREKLKTQSAALKNDYDNKFFDEREQMINGQNVGARQAFLSLNLRRVKSWKMGIAKEVLGDLLVCSLTMESSLGKVDEWIKSKVEERVSFDSPIESIEFWRELRLTDEFVEIKEEIRLLEIKIQEEKKKRIQIEEEAAEKTRLRLQEERRIKIEKEAVAENLRLQIQEEIRIQIENEAAEKTRSQIQAQSNRDAALLTFSQCQSPIARRASLNAYGSQHYTQIYQEKEAFLCKNGLPDLRYNVNRQSLVDSNGVRLKKDGTPDMRFKENKKAFGKKYY